MEKEDIKIEKICNFCGKKKPMLLNGQAGNICFQCLEECNVFMGNQFSKDFDIEDFDIEDFDIENFGIENNENKDELITPQEMKAHLDKYVIGQDNFKEKLVTAVYNHQKALRLKDKFPGVTIDKSNMLIIGPTGSGKTYTIKSLAKALDIPLAICDANNLTISGYVGDDVETILTKLYKAANNDLKKAERGIIFIDEIDKLGRKGENPGLTKDPSGEGVQQALLKIVEGCKTSFPLGGNRKTPTLNGNVEICTDDILFIIGGSFEGIEKIINKRNSVKSVIGFNSTPVNKKETNFNSLIKNIKTEDIKSFGLIPEFIGRFPIISYLEELDKDALIKILTEPKNCLTKQYKALLAYNKIDLAFSKEAIEAIAIKAIENKVGARGLRGILDETLIDIMFYSPLLSGEKIVIQKEEVENPILIKEKYIVNFINKGSVV